jgi:hypothetical protein
MADRSVVIKLPRPDYERLERVAEQQDRIAEQQAAHVIRAWLRHPETTPPGVGVADDGGDDAALDAIFGPRPSSSPAPSRLGAQDALAPN